MKDHGIRRSSPTISFASLYGMSDYVTFALGNFSLVHERSFRPVASFLLANSGYRAYKYLPYGPIDALLPYLFRRAQENRSIFEKADKDRRLHLRALKDRILGVQN